MRPHSPSRPNQPLAEAAYRHSIYRYTYLELNADVAASPWVDAMVLTSHCCANYAYIRPL
ncbi:8-amino-7-oxononanoate synthase [Mycolicibacterium novocastrense]|uniref:8-amino-7-oxononanoate synthase n=1 Tax=Mycolicibacterium novocastrense TaxID=59813 RepID=A0ABQ0KFY8_MYCNV|nr:8-amino-7-oxononanoate synthase [Mycolicibacterium novocastrense]